MLRPFTSVACASVIVPFFLTPASAAIDEYGLKLSNGSGGSLAISSTARQWGYRFTADESITIDRAVTRSNLNLGSPNLQIAIKADDGFGNPTGPDLSVGSVVAASTYPVVTMSPLALTAGNVYHMIHRVTNGDGTNQVYLRSTSPTVIQSQTDSGVPELNYGLMVSNDTGASWSVASTSDTVSWGLYNSSTNDAIGQPYSYANYHNVGGNNWRGQSFTFTGWGANTTVDAVSMQIYKGAAPVADDLRVHLIDAGTNTDLWSGVLMSKTAGATSGVGDIVTAVVPNVNLTPGQQYILALESLGSSAGDFQMAYNISDAPAPLFGENFQEAYASQVVLASSATLPLAWNGADVVDGRYDAVFAIHTTVPEPAGLSLIALGALAMSKRRGR